MASLPQPRRRNGCSLARRRFRLFPVRSPLLGKSSFLSFPAGTEMFQFPASAFSSYAFRAGFRGIASERFRIRGPPGELAWQLTGDYRSRATPFIAYRRPSIHHAPFTA